MSLKFITESILQDTADAIRAKTGETAAITPADFPDEIANIPTGGSDTFEEIMLTRTVTEYTNDNVTELPQNGLRYTPLLKITLSNLEKFKPYAFAESALEEVYLPVVDRDSSGSSSSVMPAAMYAFNNCTALKKVSIPYARAIPDSCFNGCFNLINIDMPEVEEIRGNAFNTAITATTITPFELSFPKLKNLNGSNIFYNARISKLNAPLLETVASGAFASAKYMTEIDLPATLTTTNLSRICYGCTAMTKFVCRAPITAISNNAFYNCPACLEFDFSACTTVPTLQNVACFQNINANAIIKVPVALESEWKAATNWVTFAAQIQGV